MLKKTHTKTTKYHKTTTKNTFRNVIKEDINERHKETQNGYRDTKRDRGQQQRDTKQSQRHKMFTTTHEMTTEWHKMTTEGDTQVQQRDVKRLQSDAKRSQTQNVDSHCTITKWHKRSTKSNTVTTQRHTRRPQRLTLSQGDLLCAVDILCPLTASSWLTFMKLAETLVSFSFPLFAAPACELWIHINTGGHREHGAGVGAVPLWVHSEGRAPRVHRA